MRAFLQELAWDLKGNRINVALSFIALLVAMLAFVLISVLGQIGTDTLVAQSEQVNGRAVTLQATLPTMGWSSERVTTLTTALREWPQAGYEGSLVLDRPAALAVPTGDTRSATLRLSSENYRSIRRITLSSGRWFNDSSYPGEATVNTAAARLLGGTSQGVASLDLGYNPQLSLTVVGVVVDGNSQPFVYASDRGVEASAPLLAPAQATLLVHTTAERIPAAPDKIGAALSTVGIANTPDVRRVDQAAQLKDSLSVLITVFRVVALIGLFVAILGMINVGIASVRERARDFTIRRAMGATRARIIFTISAGTFAVGVLATAAAIALSYGASKVFVTHLVDPASGIELPPYPWVLAAQVAAGGVAASILSGLAPALRTRSLDLAALLRE